MKRIISLLLTLLLVFSVIGSTAVSSFAASYPLLICNNDFEITVSEYESIKLEYTIFREYNNEKLIIVVYNENGEVVKRDERSIYSEESIVNQAYYLFTNGLPAGKYTIEANLAFYTMYEWHESPNPEKIYLTIEALEKVTDTDTNEDKDTDKPAKVKIKGVKSEAKKSMVVTWNSVSDANGYEVSYSTAKKFAKDKTKKKVVKKGTAKKVTLKKLKSNKKYFVKVRAYKTVNGTKVYGAWSKVKNVNVK